MVIFFFSLCLLLVLTGTDVNIHPIPHFQKSFPLKPTSLSLSPCATFCLPISTLLPPSLLRSFAPCSLSIKPPHFMDNLINSRPSSMKSPVFMDNPSEFHHSSMKMPHFMDNLINSVPLSTKSPIFMDNRSEFPIHP